MILKYFGFITAIFAKQHPKSVFKNDLMIENFAGFEHGFIGQPRFNESCDSDSQNAATECEDRV